MPSPAVRPRRPPSCSPTRPIRPRARTQAQDPATSGAQAPAQGSAASLTLPQLRDAARAAIDGSTTVAARQDDSTDPAESADSPADPPDIPDNALRDLPVASTAAARHRAGVARRFPCAPRHAAGHGATPCATARHRNDIAERLCRRPPAQRRRAVLPTPSSGPGSPFDSLPALQPLSDSNAWSQGLGERLLLMADKGLQSATIKLQPGAARADADPDPGG